MNFIDEKGGTGLPRHAQIFHLFDGYFGTYTAVVQVYNVKYKGSPSTKQDC